MRILLRFPEGDLICPFHEMFRDLETLKDVICPFDPTQKKRTMVYTKLHNFNKKKTRCLVYVEQEPS